MQPAFELRVFSPHPDSPTVRLIENLLGRPAAAIVVPCQPAPGARVQFCFENVRDVVKEHGGRIVYGWVVWQQGEIFVEAEFHAVWGKDNGDWICITPQTPPEVEVTFIPDPNAVYDFETNMVTDSLRVGLFDDAALENFLLAAASQTVIRNRGSRADWPHIEFTPEDKDALMRLEQVKGEVFRLAIQNRLKSVQRNELCPCGSGRKFKKCHGIQ